jgi:hypothetical protein
MSTNQTPANMENQTPATEAPAPQGALSFTVPAVTLRAALKACAPAMSEDVNRPVINGAFFELAPAPGALSSHDVLSIVATDGRRLHVAQIPVFSLTPGAPRKLAFILPASAVGVLMKTCLPAKLKTGEARLTFAKRSNETTDLAGLTWMTVQTSAGEVYNPERAGNYPMFRHVMPRPTIADDSFSLSLQDMRNAGEMIKEADAAFSSACLRAACQSAADRRLPFTEAQVKQMIAPTVKRMLRKARERDYSAYFERIHSGRLIPLPLAVGPVPAWQMMDDGRPFTNGEDKVCLNYAGNPLSLGAPPAPASAAFNPRYLADVAEAVAAFESANGYACGALQAHAADASFMIQSASLPLDSGKGFSFYAVIMPQRLG